MILTLIFSKGFFTSSLPASISKICLLSTIYLCHGMMLFIMSHFFVKTIVFIELVKAIFFKKIFENIQKVTTDQGDDHTTGCPLDHSLF